MSKKIGLNQGWYLRVAASLPLVVAIALPSNSSDVKTQQSPWNELKIDTTSEAQQENTTTTTEVQQNTDQNSELEEEQKTPMIIDEQRTPMIIVDCVPVSYPCSYPDYCYDCDG